jgi:hypothetical protein
LLWPSAEPSLEAIARELAPYLDPPFRSAHAFSRVLRVGRGSLSELGVASLDELADVVVGTEWWHDGRARWGSAHLDDPWPADPAGVSAEELRTLRAGALGQRVDARRSIAFRTLWSRSVILLEETLHHGVVLEARYEPAPFVAALPTLDGGELTLPRDLPVDVLASLVRGGTLAPDRLDALLARGDRPEAVVALTEIRTGEPATFDVLRRLLAAPATRDLAIELCIQEGARGLLYELECDTPDEALRARLAERLAFKLVGGAS